MALVSTFVAMLYRLVTGAAAVAEQLVLLVTRRRVAVRRRRAVGVKRPVRGLVATVERGDIHAGLCLGEREELVRIAPAAVVRIRVAAGGAMRDRDPRQIDGLRFIPEQLDGTDRRARRKPD